MKKVILLFAALLSLTAIAQPKPPAPRNYYIGFNYSIGKQNDGQTFSDVTYPSIEVGYCPDSTSYGFIVGRGSFNGIATKQDTFNSYYWEAKITPSKTIGRVVLSAFVGTGAYVDTKHYFGEIGAGVGYKVKNLTYSVGYSNWDTEWYLTPCITYNF